MRIRQRITIGDITYIFTENPEKDVIGLKKMYEDEERTNFMGYETPEIADFNFLGKNYKAISFWHDNEDIEEIEI